MSKRSQHGLRSALAQEAARMMAEHGIRDFGLAKRKAAERLGVPLKGNLHGSLPRNVEIQEALDSYQRLFMAEDQEASIAAMRRVAVEAMRMLSVFRPRLVGPVLDGTSHPSGAVNIHLFADTAEEVVMELMRLRVPYEESERRLKLADGRQAGLPLFRFFAGEQQVDLTVFEPRHDSRPPLSPVNGRPMRRAGLDEVEAMIGAPGV